MPFDGKPLKEIFDERIIDIKNARETFNNAALETMRQQRLSFDGIIGEIRAAVDNDNIDDINGGLYKMAELLKVDIPYNNTKEFVEYMDTVQRIEL